MQFLTTLLGGLTLAASTFAQASTGRACPAEDTSIFESCACPPGTEFQISTTYAMLGVSAADFNNYTSSFYDIAWQGITNLTFNGPDYTVGSTRTFVGKFPQGTLTFTEQLVSFQETSDGSYRARFSQFNIPVQYSVGNGSFSGYWITFDAQSASEFQTAINWNVYACFTGNPFNFGKGHVASLNRLLETMDKAGLVKGNTTGPYFVQSF